ncbi:hypothetical protein BL240_25575 [Pseudomonas putida]|uniref:Uncharacterized protein n=1 Tax=Pseudomonas putida TaxID=303 RepID=A0A1L5PWR8_PSEPU|nr:hypothetical protein BL240_25575 [Pseudomonas putida]
MTWRHSCVPAWANSEPDPIIVGAGVPAKQATRWMAPASPVFAGMPAPTSIATQGPYLCGQQGCAVSVGAGKPAKKVTPCSDTSA